MTIPHQNKLLSQSFNFTFVEFEWQFDNLLFVFGVRDTGLVYMETGECIYDAEDGGVTYREEPEWASLEPHHDLQNPGIWKNNIFPPAYNFFTNGKDLVPLVQETIEYLRK